MKDKSMPQIILVYTLQTDSKVLIKAEVCIKQSHKRSGLAGDLMGVPDHPVCELLVALRKSYE